MKGNDEVIKSLNHLLTEELTAINQYMLNAEICDNWGYEKLHEHFEKQAIDEMHHAEWLIGRVIFLEGQPNVYKINPFKPGKDVKEMLDKDLESEADAVKIYNEAIDLCAKQLDNGSRDLLIKILNDEERHIDWAEAQLDQINQMGYENYLMSLK
jgi:bacterioferritin